MQRAGSWNRLAVRLVLLLCTVAVTGCASSSQAWKAHDPLEPANRKFYAFNQTLDRNILEPVANAYVRVTPEKVRNRVRDFFDNAAYPNTVANDFLQGKINQGLSDTMRFVINSSVGVLGMFDVASAIGLPSHYEDLGITFGVWGSGEIAYLDIPFVGPNSVRDAPDLYTSTFTNALYYLVAFPASLPLSVLNVVDKRSRLSTAIKIREQAALDPYVFTREAYHQRRRYEIYGGNPPLEEFEEQ